MPGNAVIGALRVTAGLDTAEFTEGLSRMQAQLKSAGARLSSIGKGIATVGAGWTAAITAPLIGLGAIAVGEASEMKDALGQVGAALTSMGDVGGRSLDQLKMQADRLAGSSLFEDDQILRGVTANLLTFGNVAGPQFDRAQQAAVDLATRLRMDLQPATILVGKALNDPIKGMAALGRAGIQLTDSQKATIRSMVAAGDAAGAQGILLGELERQFGGSAQAARDNAPPLERMKLAFKSMAGDIGTLLLPAVERIASMFEGLTAKFGTLSPAMQKTVVTVGLVAAAIGPLLVGLGGLVAAAGAIATAFAGGGALAGLLPFLGPIGLAVGAVVIAFMAFKDDIIPVLQSFAGSLKENLGPKIAPLFEALKGAVAAIGTVFTAIFSSGGGSASANLKAFGEIVARILGAAVDIITGGLNVITNLFNALGAAIRGDFSSMWGYLGEAVMSALRAIGNAFNTLFPTAMSSIRNLVNGVRDWLVTRFQSMVVEPIRQKIEAVKGFFFGLYDAVVGHSYIPDMVEGVAAWMAKLDAGMVVPAANATAATKDAFQRLRDDVAVIMEGLLTDAERNAREVAAKIAKIRALAAQGGMSQQEAAGAEAGVWGEGLTNEPTTTIDRSAPMVDPAAQDALASLAQTGQRVGSMMSQAMEGVQGAIGNLADGLINLAVTGQGSLGDLLKSFVSTVAGIVLQMLALKAIEMATGIPVSALLGKSGARVGDGNFFSNLLGFKDGGSFTVGGSGGADSKLAAFRVSPGEKVDISTKRQQRDSGGAGKALYVQVDKSQLFDVAVHEIAAPMVARGMASAAGFTRSQVHRDLETARTYSRNRG